jgi:ribosomal protein S27AE
MRELIQMQNEDLRPRIVCGKCREEILIDITPFKNDCAKILKDRCPKCHAELFVGILILAHPQMKGLMGILQTILRTLNKSSRIIGGRKQ